ncbi:NADH:flavin oxidoreductase/NADH oxidase [Microbacterium sp. SORGH_AS_0888]|uniref:NADH:flavin oxidoreductase/NADH oxidase n=1 Tax=Microbacterium sp. SORGH_AS_0888 TaxID=3041791 RepID=UPI002786D10E|nr:NADH:flavin oxidoreductase/NADH oxidase [Microbacterium sp. SORGH_AS_0888]MDQ1129326.1 2,4-dienoyl-CoA reductase-like NADH-dependent reductase (Old Yellow Enzyme family) [Microbacterium sp. SORGH_AS_0888]
MHAPRLFTPIAIRGLEVRNRLWVSPMCQYSADAEPGMPTPWHLVHLGSMAAGGAGAVILEATGVVPEGRISARDLGLWNDAQRDALRPIVEFVHARGAAVGIQLAHAGRKASTHPPFGTGGRGSVPIADGGWEAVAPSAVAFGDYAVPRALTVDEIAGIVTAFAAAARRAVQAGFDLVELHAAHGYLLHQFLSPLSNRRSDEYGGSLENRARLLLEVLEAVRAAVGESVPVLVRFSATDWAPDGWTPEETSIVAGWAAARGADLFDVSTGGLVPGVDIPTGPGYQLPFAAAVRQRTGMPVAAVGQIDRAEQAEQALVSGQADVILSAREMLRDRNFALRAARELGATPPVPGQYARAFA